MSDRLRLENLSASIKGQQVVEDVSLTVPDSGVTAVLGRNGVGKTSTLKAIMGLISRSGKVTFDGTRIDREHTHHIVRRGIGYVPEDREIFGGLTVAENMRLATRDAKPRKKLVDELFPDLVGRANQRAGTLSGGQQQMLSLARVLINDNRLLLVDEPTKGLAPRLVDQVTEALEEAARTTPILLVEQNLPVIERLAEQAVVIDAGVVVHTGDTAELLADEVAVQRFLGISTDGEATEAESTDKESTHQSARTASTEAEAQA